MNSVKILGKTRGTSDPLTKWPVLQSQGLAFGYMVLFYAIWATCLTRISLSDEDKLLLPTVALAFSSSWEMLVILRYKIIF